MAKAPLRLKNNFLTCTNNLKLHEVAKCMFKKNPHIIEVHSIFFEMFFVKIFLRPHLFTAHRNQNTI